MRSHRSNIRLTLAVNDSDQVRDVVSGVVPVEGVDLTCLHYEVEEIFFRFTKYREWDISEMSLGKYCALRSRGDDSLVGLPVFPSRAFRHSGIYIRSDGPVDDPGSLAGARVGIPEWTVTATVYQRALLAHEYGLDLADIAWVQGGINEPGRIETLPSALPDGVQVRREDDQSLNELLLDGEIDAVLVPHPPDGATDGTGRLVPLFSDAPAVEADYFRRSGVFPIMHLLVLRRETFDAHPWTATNLVTAFTEAKDRSQARLLDPTAPHFPLPWGPDRARQAQSLLGDDLWPYGLEANRPTLDAFLGFAAEQRLTDGNLRAEDLFPPHVRERHRI